MLKNHLFMAHLFFTLGSNHHINLIKLCPEMHAYDMHELYDRHHKVSPNLNSYQNTNNSVEHEVI